MFPRRIVTRPATEFEDHDTLTEEEFSAAVADGRLAFWWSAHGLRYGVPCSIDADIRAGRTVVCNTSRAVAPDLRARYRRTVFVLVSAPNEVLAARLSARGRTSDGEGQHRLNRAGQFAALHPDFTIENVGDAETGIKALTSIIRSGRALSEMPAELLF